MNNSLKRIPTTMPTRMGAGYVIGFMAWVLLLIFLFCIIIAPVPVKLVLALSSLLPLSVCLYGYIKCGVFYTQEYIIEKRYFETVKIKICDISEVNLAYYAGGKYYETVISLQDKNIDPYDPELMSKQANASFFYSLFHIYKTPGTLQLKTVRKIFRKNVAHKFAQELLQAIRTGGNTTAAVKTQQSSSYDGQYKTGYAISEDKFWKDFKENYHQ